VYLFRYVCRRSLLPLILWTIGTFEVRATSLVLSSSEALPGVHTSLALLLDASFGERPSAIQWTFHYPAATISHFTVEAGPALVAAGKTVICAGDADALNCLIVGINDEAIPGGLVAKLTVALAPGVSSMTIMVANVLGVSSGGEPISISSANGTINAVNSSPVRNLRERTKRRYSR
jgi:hypothetical protein